jgi:hypothetical protein
MMTTLTDAYFSISMITCQWNESVRILAGKLVVSFVKKDMVKLILAILRLIKYLGTQRKVVRKSQSKTSLMQWNIKEI